jgi:hypothetical protein
MALLIEPPYRPMKALSVAPQRTFGSLLLGLYDDQGLLHHVGFTSGFRRDERKGSAQWTNSNPRAEVSRREF